VLVEAGKNLTMDEIEVNAVVLHVTATVWRFGCSGKLSFLQFATDHNVYEQIHRVGFLSAKTSSFISALQRLDMRDSISRQ
jgi:hypothetical protein